MDTTPKRTAVMAAGRALFLRHGIRKVRVQEVCADARVSKRTFYKYFRDKDDLAIAVLGELFDESRTHIEAVLGRDCSLEEKVRQLIAVKSRLASETSATFYREAVDGATAPGRFALQEQRRWDARVRRFYREAQARGEIRADIDIDVLMALIARVRDLATDPALARLVPDFTHLVETLMRLFFYGIVPRTEPRGPTAPRKKRRTS